MKTEVVYLGHDNSIDFILYADDVAVDLTPVTTMTLNFGNVLVASGNGAADPIRWIQSGYATGEIRMKLGAQAIPADKYSSQLVVYDPTYTAGIVWAEIPIEVFANDV